MKNVIHSLVAVAGLATVANAQVANTLLKYEVSRDGVNWSSTLNANPGDTIQVRALASYIGSASAPTAGGLGQIVFQPVVSSWTGADTLITTAGTPGNNGVGPVGGTRSTPIGTVEDAPGQYGRITPFGANSTTTSTYLRGHVGTGTAAGLLRIARADVTNWIGVGATSGASAANNWNGGGGVSIAQIANPSRLPTDPAFNNGTSNLVVFKFSFLVGAGDGRSLVINTPDAGFNRTLSSGQYVPNIRWFANENEASASVQTAAVAEAATIRVVPVPAPGAMALLGLGGLVAARRRR